MITAFLLLPVLAILLWLYAYLLPQRGKLKFFDFSLFVAVILMASAYVQFVQQISWVNAGPMWPDLVSAVGDTGEGHCWRYDAISQSLSDHNGSLLPQDAVALLEKVSQDGTQWSIVYNIFTGDVQIVMGQNFGDVHVLKSEW